MKDGYEKRNLGSLRRHWIGAPAAVMLATCVGAQAATQSSDSDPAPQAARSRCAAPDLGTALRGVAACSNEQASKALAQQATYVIHTLDRLSCVKACEIPPCLDSISCGLPLSWPAYSALFVTQYDPVRSTHQPAAP